MYVLLLYAHRAHSGFLKRNCCDVAIVLTHGNYGNALRMSRGSGHTLVVDTLTTRCWTKTHCKWYAHAVK